MTSFLACFLHWNTPLLVFSQFYGTYLVLLIVSLLLNLHRNIITRDWLENPWLLQSPDSSVFTFHWYKTCKNVPVNKSYYYRFSRCVLRDGCQCLGSSTSWDQITENGGYRVYIPLRVCTSNTNFVPALDIFGGVKPERYICCQRRTYLKQSCPSYRY